MKLLLTSGGVSNPSIRDALLELLDKPIGECDALYIPTAIYGIPGLAKNAWRAVAGVAQTPLVELGWKSVGVLELTALPSMEGDGWADEVAAADVLLVGGATRRTWRTGIRLRATPRSASSSSRSSRTLIIRICPRTRWRMRRAGRPRWTFRPTRSTMPRPSASSTEKRMSSQRGTGSYSLPIAEHEVAYPTLLVVSLMIFYAHE